MRHKRTKKEFIEVAKTIHGNAYSYSKAVYEGSQRKIEIYCKKCKAYFMQTPGAHLKGAKCPKCAKLISGQKLNISLKEFLKRAKQIHGSNYIYEKESYINCKSKVRIHCKKCESSFEQQAQSHLHGKGCANCAGNTNSTTESFIDKATKLHGSKYDYSEVEYGTARTKVKIICKECEQSFMQEPRSHLSGSGCPICCQDSRYSKIAIQWLEHEAKRRRIKIQHALNGGEFQIPNTRFRVDGYHKPSNTVFEFHGDIYHGNPELFHKNSTPNPYSDKTAGQLYRETMKREKLIQSLGYNLVTIWQNDFKKLRRSLKAGVVRV